MAKPKPAASPFDALIQARQQTSSHSDSQTSSLPDVQTFSTTTVAQALAKSADPRYTKFTTYVLKDTHLAVKLKAMSQGKELSDLVEQLLSDWLQRQSS